MIHLPELPHVGASWRSKLERVIDRTRAAPPPDIAAIARDELDIDLTTTYAGFTIPHPFGKGSGQLSCTLNQVETDVAAGLAFVVLKTVIAEAPDGSRSMEAWTVPETRMRVERRRAASGRDGWTVTWKGRGWSGSLEQYQALFEGALRVARGRDVPVVPSVKYHLPAAGEPFREPEYRHTTAALLDVWDRAGCGGPMIVEKDLSPTLAGDARAGEREHVLDWVCNVPGLVERAAPGKTRLGIKLMNALFDDRFQAEMVRSVITRSDPAPAFLVVFNRLFDLRHGIAYGGWDLSDRNLRVLEALRLDVLPPLSATGNICSGRMMLAYALRGCENGQLHTFFQLPLSEYTASAGSRPARALHTLLLHPTEGLCVWLRHLADAGCLEPQDGVLRFQDIVGLCV